MTSISKNMSLALGAEEILVNTVSPGSFASDGFKAGVAMLAGDRDLDPDNLFDCMEWIRQDFSHPAHLPRAGDPDGLHLTSPRARIVAAVGEGRRHPQALSTAGVDPLVRFSWS